jgi:putative transposase
VSEIWEEDSGEHHQAIHRAAEACLSERSRQRPKSRLKRICSGFIRRASKFKSRFRYHSLTFKQYGNSFNVLGGGKKNRGTLVLAKLGYVSISSELSEREVQERGLPGSIEEVGIDVGLKTFAYLSTGEEIANPRFFHAEEAALARAQRKLTKAPKGTKERAHKRKIVARIHERIANRRKTFIAQEVSKLIRRFGLLAVEALVVRNMVKNPKLAKSIADASWSMFFKHLQAKAEEAGRQVVRVNPAYTSQTCSACGYRQPMPLAVRVYECPHCGLIIHRDHNGSLNILAGAREAVGRHSRVIPEAPGLEPRGVVTAHNSGLST